LGELWRTPLLGLSENESWQGVWSLNLRFSSGNVLIKNGDSQELVSAILEIYPLAGVPYAGWTKEEAPGINPGP
jgi:hypothetical protein